MRRYHFLLQVLLKSASAKLPSRRKAGKKQKSTSSSSGALLTLEPRVERSAHGNAEFPALTNFDVPNCGPRVDWTACSCSTESGRNAHVIDATKLVKNWKYACSKMGSTKLQLVPVSPGPMNITMLKQSKRRLWMVSNPLYGGYQDDEVVGEKKIKSCRPRFY